MQNQLVPMLGDSITFMIITITLVLFVFFVYREYLSLQQARQQLKDIAGIKSNADSNEIPWNKVNDVQRVWILEHLVYASTSNGVEIESKNNQWLTKSPISQLLPPHDSARYKLIPALLTSIGITGTFLGITMGLSQFDMGGDSKALLASAGELLEGMKTAFYTSLAGLSSSAIFMAYMKYSSSALAKEQRKFISKLSSDYFEASAIHYLKNISNNGQQEVIEAQMRSAQVMESMGEKMEATTQTLAQLGSSFNGDVIAEKVSTALSSSIENTMAPMLGSIKQELDSLKDIKEQSQKELVQLLINEMKVELIVPVTEELNKTSAAVTNSNEIAAQLNSNVERVVTSTSETVNTINEFQKETMLKLQSFAESLKDILNSFKEDTQGAMTSIASEVQSMLENTSQGMEQQRIAFEQSAQRASGAFVEMKDSLESALDERQKAEKGLFDSVTNRVSSLLDDVTESFESQTSVIAQTGEEASKLMQSAKAELQQGLGDIDTKVKSMSDTVQKELDAFRLQYQENLTSYFEQQNDILESSLSKQRTGLNEVVENFRQVFESEYKARHNLLQELTAQYEKLEASAGTIERVAKAIGLNEASKMAELQDVAHTMSREIALLKKEYAQASATFTDVIENLPKAMDDYFSRANESFETFFKDFDHSASTIHNKLSQAAGYLINAESHRRERELDEANA
ncbi:chemotaxis protein [Vibrio fluvialis]|nr:chemotaxis protein [Vibrio fluvialis]